MPTIIGHHDVKDTEHWLASSKHEGVCGRLGITNIRTFVDPEKIDTRGADDGTFRT